MQTLLVEWFRQEQNVGREYCVPDGTPVAGESSSLPTSYPYRDKKGTNIFL
jgi:hypothetical protein